MTMKSIPITLWFVAITVAQCVLGIYMTVLTARQGGEVKPWEKEKQLIQHAGVSSVAAQPQPSIPLDAYHLCVFSQPDRRVEVAYTSLSLFFGAFEPPSVSVKFG